MFCMPRPCDCGASCTFIFDRGYGRGVTPNFHSRFNTKNGCTSYQGYGRGGTPNFHYRLNAKKGYNSYQGYCTPNFHYRVNAKKGYNSYQGYGRAVRPIFTTGSTPKKGIPLIKATPGRYPQFSMPGQRQKKLHL